MEEAKVLEEMKRLSGTQTEKNLRAAFAGESQAHVKYNLFAAEAEKDPSISRQIADLFRETGANEKAHAILREAKEYADETIKNFNKYGKAAQQ